MNITKALLTVVCILATKASYLGFRAKASLATWNLLKGLKEENNWMLLFNFLKVLRTSEIFF